jgi:hypothetical protein
VPLRESCTYARVDMVMRATGPVLMELELIEPFLNLSADHPHALRRFHTAIDELVRSRKAPTEGAPVAAAAASSK